MTWAVADPVEVPKAVLCAGSSSIRNSWPPKTDATATRHRPKGPELLELNDQPPDIEGSQMPGSASI
jgi:hypothetical protein